MQPDAQWLEIEIARDGDEVRASARAGGSVGQPATHLLGPHLGRDALLAFAGGVREAAEKREPLGPSLLAQAEEIYRALFRDGIDALRSALKPRSGGPLIVRFRVHDPDLQKVPWEAIEAPGQVRGFLGTSADLLPARAPEGDVSDERSTLREVRDALRALVVAPAGTSTVDELRRALNPRIDEGEIELNTREGPAAEPRHLLEYLRSEPPPNVLHFVCHGGLRRGAPALCLGDEDDDTMWLSVAALAQHLEAHCRGPLRLVILQACSGASPTDVASAAEILARKSVNAVVAHLWPVEADVARICSVELYGALAGGDRSEGNIAVALNDARRILLAELGESACAFSPVLYLRTGTSAALFDLRRRKLIKPAPAPVLSDIDPALPALLQKPFAVLIGDCCGAEGAALDELEKRLLSILMEPADPNQPGLPIAVPPGLPLSALAQRVAFHYGRDELNKAFQKAFPEVFQKAAPSPLLDAIARIAPPGIHLTLLRSPRFELALAQAQPHRTLFVLQPGEKGTAILCRSGESNEWKQLRRPPASLDLTQDIVVLRLYRGYTPELILTSPLLTEDDFLHDLHDLESVLPEHLADSILKSLDMTPALLVGLSLHMWDHRELFRKLFASRKKHLPDGSLVVVDPKSPEASLWRDGIGLPDGSRVRVVEATGADLTHALAAFAQESAR